MPQIITFAAPKLMCPACFQPSGVFLPNVSAEARVDYYRCKHCANVWTREKRRDEYPDAESARATIE